MRGLLRASHGSEGTHQHGFAVHVGCSQGFVSKVLKEERELIPRNYDDPVPDDVCDAVEAALAKRGLTLVSNFTGMRVVWLPN